MFMKRNKAFTLAETLLTIFVISVLLGSVIAVVNSQERKNREFLGVYNMLVPQLAEIAAQSSQLADRPETDGATWWALSNSLEDIDCEGEDVTSSDCLKQAFMESAKNMDEPDEEPVDMDEINVVLGQMLGEVGEFSVGDMRFAQMNEGVIVGFLYTDPSCMMELESSTGGFIRSCGLIFVDVNGNRPPNRIFTRPVEGEELQQNQNNPNQAYDRYFVALTKNGVKQTSLINGAARCANGETFAGGQCAPLATCPLSEESVEYAELLRDANAERAITLYYPLGEELDDCFSARCRDGLPPDENYECNPICDPLEDGTITQRLGGLYITEGGIREMLVRQKECCVPISTQAELSGIRNNLTRTYCLVNDIELTSNWDPIASFNGKLYGNGHRIFNINIIETYNAGANVGFFSSINDNAEIHDLELVGVNYVLTINGGGTYKVGSLVGHGSKGVLSNIVASGAISISSARDNATVQAYYGGIVGFGSSFNNIINNVSVNRTINASIGSNETNRSGGIVGATNTAERPINNAVNNAEVTVLMYEKDSYARVGGIAGEETPITNAINNANISVNLPYAATGSMTGRAGGIIGRAVNHAVRNVINNGATVSAQSSTYGTSFAGGIAGDITAALGSFISRATVTATGKNGSVHKGTIIGNDATLTNPTLEQQSDMKTTMPPQFGLGWAAMIESPNTFIGDDEDNPEMWAYIVPPVNAAGQYAVNKQNALALRWQCKPYREDGLDCCVPEYAKVWETEIPACRATP